MKAMQAVKKMVALGMGLTMVGATIFGASAVKLSDYPAPFVVNGTPANNLAIIVGDQADGSDVVGAVDVIQSLQSQAVVKVAAAGQPSQLVVEGDAVEIGSTSDLLEIGEPIGDVRETLTEVDLDMLKGGQIVTDQGSTEFNQYLRFPNNLTSGVVLFAKDERDRVGHYLFWQDGNTIFEWELEFEEGLQSRVEGNDLVDLEDEDVTVLGQPFVIVDTDLLVNNVVLANLGSNGNSLTGTNATPDLTLKLIGGAVSAVLGENDKETYVVDGKEYEVEVLVISETSHNGDGSVKFRINGEITDELQDGETDVLADGTQIGIRDILATGKDIQKSIVQFYLGAYKVEFRDTNTSDTVAVTAGTQVNEETIEDSLVTIRGQFISNSPQVSSLTGSKYEVASVRYNLTANAVLGDLYVPPGSGVRAQLNEPEGMLTPNWDIRYEGLMDTGVTLVRISSAGNDEYDFEFTNQEGIFFDSPLASNEKGGEASSFGLTGGSPAFAHQLKYGDNNDNLWFTEFSTTSPTPFNNAAVLAANQFYIQKQDFFVLSNCNLLTTDDTCFSHVLRFDNVCNTNRHLTFTDLGTGTREVTYDPVTFLASLVVGGITYTVGVANTGAGAALVPTNLTIDLNGDGNLINDTHVLIGIQGEGLVDLGKETDVIGNSNSNGAATAAFNIAGVYQDPPSSSFNVSILTLAKEFDEAIANENVSVNVTARASNRIGIDGIENGTPATAAGLLFGLFNLEENDALSQALSGYGVFFELYDPTGSDDAEDLTVEYPLSERGARVFVTGGVVSTTSVEAGGVERVQPIQIGAAKLASEVSDVSMYNAIVVGGPCANPIAASLLGNPDPCYESVPENKSLVKLFEHTNGNVALLINGRTALNTRQGARAVATGAIGKVSGMEAEVTGTTLADVTVTAV